MDCSMPGFPVHHQLPELAQTHVQWVSDAIQWWWCHLILCCPFLLLPSIFPSVRVFSSASVLCIRWPEYWGFSFSISPSKEYSGLISLGFTKPHGNCKPKSIKNIHTKKKKECKYNTKDSHQIIREQKKGKKDLQKEIQNNYQNGNKKIDIYQ